jgi:putative chitinase
VKNINKNKTMEITNDLLKKLLPDSTEANRQKYAPYFNKYLPKYGIVSEKQVAAFFAQIGTESGQLKYNKEIASGSAYEGRKDLGNINPGDGVKFKGRGLIQITGRSNYEKAGKALGADFINQPELLEQPEWAVKSACWWWNNAGLNNIAG